MSNHRKYKKSLSATNPKIIRVAKNMSKYFTSRHIKHVVIGGLAVAAHGYERATKDVDFLISNESQETIAGDPLGGEVWGKTILMNRVHVDLLFPKPHEVFLEAAFQHAKIINDMPTVDIEVLIYLKLSASRAKDQADIIELLKRGRIHIKNVVTYLKKHAPEYVDDFQQLVHQAQHEPD